MTSSAPLLWLLQECPCICRLSCHCRAVLSMLGRISVFAIAVVCATFATAQNSSCGGCGFYSYSCDGTAPNDDSCAVCRIDISTYKNPWDWSGTCAPPKCGVPCVDHAPDANNCGGWYTGPVKCPICVTKDASLVGTCQPGNALCGAQCDFNMPGNRSTCKGDCVECVADGPTSFLGTCKTPRCGHPCVTDHECGRSYFTPAHESPCNTCFKGTCMPKDGRCYESCSSHSDCGADCGLCADGLCRDERLVRRAVRWMEAQRAGLRHQRFVLRLHRDPQPDRRVREDIK